MSLKVRDIQVWQPSIALALVPVAIMISHMVVSGYLDHQSTQFRLSASELLLFVSGAGSNEMHYEHYMEFQTAMTLSLSNSFIMTKKAISIYCFIVSTV